MILIGIAISIGAIVSIWISAQSQEYMYKEGDRRERVLNKEGESLVLVHVVFDATIPAAPVLTLTLQNNGTSDMEVAYVKVDGLFYRQTTLTCDPSSCEVDYDSMIDVSVTLPASYERIEDVNSLEVGSILGNLFIFNAPSPEIRVTSTFFDTDNLLVTFSAERSVDSDGQIVKWEWCFHYDETNEVCNVDPDTSDEYGGTGEVYSFQYNDDDLGAGNYVVSLTVTDDTGLVGFITIDFTVPTIT
jgi:hypothetical protein